MSSTSGDLARNRELIARLFKLNDSLKRGEISVVCIGPYNHGKSSLLNALTGSYDDSRFKVEDKRTTASIQRFSIRRRELELTYVDSPGLGHSQTDEELAIKGELEASLLLYVHDLSHGELKQDEISYLRALVDRQGPSILGRMVFALTKKEECSGDVDSIIKTIDKQLLDSVFRSNPYARDLLAVSANSYKKGKRDDKRSLVKGSNVEALEKLIDERASRLCSDRTGLRGEINRVANCIYVEIDKAIASERKKLAEKVRKRDDLQREIEGRYNEWLQSYKNIS